MLLYMVRVCWSLVAFCKEVLGGCEAAYSILIFTRIGAWLLFWGAGVRGVS